MKRIKQIAQRTQRLIQLLNEYCAVFLQCIFAKSNLQKLDKTARTVTAFMEEVSHLGL